MTTHPAEAGIIDHFDEHERCICASRLLSNDIAQAAQLMADTLSGGFSVFACGNGGSAADAQHLVAELVGRFESDRAGRRAFTLPGDEATLTSLANDFGFDSVFERSLAARARPGDLLVALSTSGNSPNVVNAVKFAPSISVRTLALTGSMPNPVAHLAELTIAIPAQRTARIQEAHGLCIHALVDAVDHMLADTDESR